ncbi:MAG TPA: YfhO family protein, partial [Armatimonadota bacterium]|nr:YfhO family protein [Armatimonadota bacterium]
AFIAYALVLLPPGDSRGQRLRALTACLGLPLVLAGMIAAGQALPVLELSRLSHRAGGSLLAASAAGYQHQALPFWASIVLLLPRFFGSPAQGNAWGPANYAEFVGYAGVLPSLLAALLILGLAVPGWRARITAALPGGAARRIWFFVALALLAVAAGFNTPLGTLFYTVVPGFGGFGSPGRILSLFSVALAILCGFGMQLLLESPVHSLTRPILAAAGLVTAKAAILLLIAVQGAAALGAGDPGTIFSQSADSCTRFFGLLLLGAMVLALSSSGQLSPTLSRGILPALVALDLLAFAWGFNPTAPAALAYPPSPVLSALRARAPHTRFLAITPRWTLDQFPVAVLPPNGATACGLYDINGYDSLYLAAYKEVLNQTGGRESSPQANGNMVLFDAVDAPGFRELGCEYVLTLLPITDKRFTLVQDGPVLLYRFGGALPRTFLSTARGDTPLPGSEARIVEENATRLRLKLRAPRECVLSLRDAFYPGWQAQVDGKPVAIARDHGAFRAVAIPAGTQEVLFHYEPMSFRLGLFLSLLALGCLAGAVGFRYVKS